MSIYRTEEFQRIEASRQPYDGPPQVMPLNRVALNWLMAVVDDRTLSPDAPEVFMISFGSVKTRSMWWGSILFQSTSCGSAKTGSLVVVARSPRVS